MRETVEAGNLVAALKAVSGKKFGTMRYALRSMQHLSNLHGYVNVQFSPE